MLLCYSSNLMLICHHRLPWAANSTKFLVETCTLHMGNCCHEKNLTAVKLCNWGWTHCKRIFQYDWMEHRITLCNVHANTAPFSQVCPWVDERHGATPDQIFLFHNICDICESLLTVGSHIGSKYWIKQIPPRSLARSNVIVANITDSHKRCLQYSF